MPIMKNVTVYWVKCAVDEPQRYQNKADAPAKWSVQVRTHDKATKTQWEKEYGMSLKPEEGENGIFYKTSLSRYAFGAAAGGGEDPNKPNKPVSVILANGEALDPNTVGNGSIANISMYVKDDKSSRTLKGIQVTKLIKYEPRDDEDAFELTDDFEIIEDAGGSDDDPY